MKLLNFKTSPPVIASVNNRRIKFGQVQIGYFLILLSLLISVSATHSGIAMSIAPRLTPPIQIVNKNAIVVVVKSPPDITLSNKPTALKTHDVLAIAQPCIPDTAYGMPSKIDLTNASNGLTEVKDPPQFYKIYGNTATQVSAQIIKCAPNINYYSGQPGNYAAETSYDMSWQYNTINTSQGMCSVVDARVGLHINMVLPQWQPSTSSTPNLFSQWQKFISNLVTHENGHVVLDEQYAAQILNDLQNYPIANCSLISTDIQTKLNEDFSGLNTANDAYDIQTNYGTTQGAVLL